MSRMASLIVMLLCLTAVNSNPRQPKTVQHVVDVSGRPRQARQDTTFGEDVAQLAGAARVSEYPSIRGDIK